MNSTSPAPRSFARPQRADQSTESRSSVLRASILESALELGVGTNRTVANWIFNAVDEEDEDETEVRCNYLAWATGLAKHSFLGTPRPARPALPIHPPRPRKSRISPLDLRSAPSQALGLSSMGRMPSASTPPYNNIPAGMSSPPTRPDGHCSSTSAGPPRLARYPPHLRLQRSLLNPRTSCGRTGQMGTRAMGDT